MSSDYQTKQIGFWISQKRSGMSQAELAKKAGISQQQLSKIEAGGNCTVATLLKILDALGEKVELPVSIPGPIIRLNLNEDNPAGIQFSCSMETP